MPPEQGQIVSVRNRRYIVTDVHRSRLDPVHPQHLVKLAGIEDDGLGEELAVVWEIEPGARVFEKGLLPEPDVFDSPARFDAFLDAVRWGVVSAAGTEELQAPFRAAVDTEDYQLEPLARALQMPRVNLLIADDVGLGKTIESGLIVHELMLRHRARRIVVVCPAALQIQWREQMHDKFGLEFKIVDGALLKELRRKRGPHVNPWKHFPRLITSIDYLKRDHPRRLFQETLPATDEERYPRRYDLLIVDEAHNVAPSGVGKYATDSQRTRAIQLIAPHFEHRLFLTATPHNGYTESFTALLELLDDQRFARGVPLDRRQIRTVMIRRLKTEIKDPVTGEPRFPPRRIIPVVTSYTDAERAAHAWLQEYARLRAENVEGRERTASEFVLKLLKKRLFSSPAAFRATLAKHRHTLSRKKVAVRRPPPGILLHYLERVDEEFDNDEEHDSATSEAVLYATACFRAPSTAENELLRKLSEYAEDAAVRPDSRALQLLDWIRAELFTDGAWNDTRVLIFTEYRATQKWLLDLFAREGFLDDGRTASLYGGLQTDEREQIKAAFQARPELSPVRILVATDAASEGIDLQNFCARLFHYEIPWNPNRLEQRNGRLDRHGQREPVLVHHFVCAGYDRGDDTDAPVEAGRLEGDLEFLFRVVRKVENIREDLGKVGPVIAEQISEAMLGGRRRLDTARAESGGAAIRKLFAWERDLKRQIAVYRAQLKTTEQNLRIAPDRVARVVATALDLAEKPALRPCELPGVDGALFEVPPFGGGWAQALYGLRHPHTGRQRPITFDRNLAFDRDLARGRDDLVHAHLNHPLVRMSANLLRAEIWSPGDQKGIERVTVRRCARGSSNDVVALVYARLLVLGGDHERIQEELILAGGTVAKGRFQRIRSQEALVELEGAALSQGVSKRRREDMLKLWPKIRAGLEVALEARKKSQTKNLRTELERRRDQEMGNITAILEELAKRIAGELREDVQLTLEFSVAEREQFRRDREHLRRRLERIPGEIVKERERIRARYADPDPRLFPVAVAILIPEQLDH